MKKATAADPTYPPILIFFQGGVDEGTAFFRKLWPEARAVSDTNKTFYNAFGIKQGSWMETLGPSVLACGVRAASKGHMNGTPSGDVWLMPGLFLAAEDGRILWQHKFAHVGDHPDFAQLPVLLAPYGVVG
ncbi:MAG: hypothetical protein IPL28_11490 [Chloroflexi bacterium]|nr:hypothetical protein [Chloroflexota bacterium]